MINKQIIQGKFSMANRNDTSVIAGPTTCTVCPIGKFAERRRQRRKRRRMNYKSI